MKKNMILIALLIMLFTGCTITQEYHFNNDFSGTYKMDLAMGDFIAMMQSMDTTGNMSSLDSMDQSFIEISEKYKEFGAKNVEAGWRDDKTTIFIKFNFDDLNTLNEILKGGGDDANMLSFVGSKGTPEFSNKGSKTMTLDFPEFANDSLSMQEVEQMKEYLKMETIISFDREIKKISNKNALISGDKKSFKFQGGIEDFMKEGFTMDTDVKLKKK